MVHVELAGARSASAAEAIAPCSIGAATASTTTATAAVTAVAAPPMITAAPRDRSSGRPEHEGQHRYDEDEPADDLDDHRAWLQAEHAGEQRRRTEPGSTSHAEVEHLLLAGVDPARFVGAVQRGDDETGGDDHQHDARDAEEARQVDAEAAAVDAVPEQAGDEDADRALRWRRLGGCRSR